jgi:hypothetical protein
MSALREIQLISAEAAAYGFRRESLAAKATPTYQNRAEISQLQQPGHQISQDEMTVIHVILLIRDCTRAPKQ